MIKDLRRSLVGKSWVSASGSTIFVYEEIKGSISTGKSYIVACSVCSSDSELWPEIHMNRTSVRDEKLSCSCSAKVNYTMRQQILRASRKAKEICVRIDEIKKSKTARTSTVKTYCLKHNEENECRISTLLERKYCCSIGAVEAVQRERKIGDEEATNIFMSSGRFTHGTYFVRSESRRLWDVHCPKCKSDEYAKAGISSVWTSSTSGLCGNANPCRCAKSHYWSVEENEKRLELSGVKFIRWHKISPTAHKSYFVTTCDTHGERIVSLTSALSGRGCPGCAVSGFNQGSNGFLYCLKSEDGAFLKIGISNKPGARFAALKKKTPFEFSVIGQKEMPGFMAMQKERELHARFMNAGFKGFDGATEWFRYDDEIVSIFE